MSVLQFRVRGIPSTQGDHKAYKPKGAPFARIVDANPAKLRPWREAIRQDAVQAAGETWTPLDGPVLVTLRFALARPASAPKTRRTWPIGKRSGDVDKLARAALDALTDAGIFTDDARVTELTVSKDYVGGDVHSPGVLITVQPLDAALVIPLSRNETEGVLPL
jgi:crossover junction endodeoxyribonuclease RusA